MIHNCIWKDYSYIMLLKDSVDEASTFLHPIITLREGQIWMTEENIQLLLWIPQQP